MSYSDAKKKFAKIGIDTEKVLKDLAKVSISLHCWQGDDVGGFETTGGASGGIQTTGNYPGKARTPEELMKDLEFALALIPGKHRVNVHACYGVHGDKVVDRDKLSPKQFEPWVKWAKKTGVKSYAAWADHRRFMELTFCETIERVGKILNKELPGVPLDMSGTQAPNGWTGMDMWLVGKSVKEPAAYEGGLLGDYIRSFGRPFIKPWTGYGVQPKTLEVWPWFVAFKFLDAGLYFWTGFIRPRVYLYRIIWLLPEFYRDERVQHHSWSKHQRHRHKRTS